LPAFDGHGLLVPSALGAFCLAETGKVYVIYLPHGGEVNVKLDPGRYVVKWFNPRNGDYSMAATAEGTAWKSPAAPDDDDWVLLFTRTEIDAKAKKLVIGWQVPL
jgi:hypothetical protein